MPFQHPSDINMPSTPPVNPSPDTLFARTKRTLGLYPVPPHSTNDPVRDVLEGRVQIKAPEIPQQRPQDLQLVESCIREYEETLVLNQHGRVEFTSPIVPPEKVAAVLSVLQDRHACDTVLVHVLIANLYDDLSHEEIVEILRARHGLRHSSFESSYVQILWKILVCAESGGKKLFGAVAQLKKWETLINENYYDSLCVQDIRDKAKATLKGLHKNEAEQISVD